MKRQSELIKIIGTGLSYERSTKSQVNSAGRSLLSIAPNIELIENALIAAQSFIDSHVADPDLTEEMIEKYASYNTALNKIAT